MEELLPMITERDGIPVTTSRAVAEQFGKRHDHVLRDIEELLDQLKNPPTAPKSGGCENPGNGSNFGAVDSPGTVAVAQLQAFQFAELNFHPVTYRDSTGRERPMYLLTRDAFTLLAMGFTGARAVQFKVAYINAFNRMERLLKGGITSGDVQRIENRLEILEQTASQGKQTAADSVADLFLQAIREALSTGGYYLGEKYKRNKQDSPQLLGVADWDTVALKATLAYDLYAAATHRPLKRAVLWGMLEQAGTIKPRSDLPAEVKICGRDYTVIYLNRSQIEPIKKG